MFLDTYRRVLPGQGAPEGKDGDRYTISPVASIFPVPHKAATDEAEEPFEEFSKEDMSDTSVFSPAVTPVHPTNSGRLVILPISKTKKRIRAFATSSATSPEATTIITTETPIKMFIPPVGTSTVSPVDLFRPTFHFLGPTFTGTSLAPTLTLPSDASLTTSSRIQSNGFSTKLAMEGSGMATENAVSTESFTSKMLGHDGDEQFQESLTSISLHSLENSGNETDVVVNAPEASQQALQSVAYAPTTGSPPQAVPLYPHPNLPDSAPLRPLSEVLDEVCLFLFPFYAYSKIHLFKWVYEHLSSPG